MQNVLDIKNMDKPTYKIFVLDDDEFDNLDGKLPYMTKEKLGDSLGFANPKTNEAYIRRTGIGELDQGTLHHEVMELIQKTSPDEIDGIRYKKGGALKSIVPILLGFIPGIGPALGAIAGAGMNAYAANKHPELGSPFSAAVKGGITGGLGAYSAGNLLQGGIAGGTQAAPGFLSKAGGIAKGALLGTPASVGTGTLGTGQAVSTYIPPTKGLLGGGGAFLGGGSKASQAASAQWANPANVGLASQAGNLFGATAPQVATETIGKSLFSGFKNPQTILGATSILGSTGLSAPQFEMPASVSEFKNSLLAGKGFSQLGAEAQAQLQKALETDPTKLPETTDQYYSSIVQKIDENYDLAAQQLDAQYNQLGMYGSGEHLAAKQNLQNDLAQTKSSIYAEIANDQYKFATQQKFQALTTALNVDAGTLAGFLELAALDVNLAAQQYQMSVEDVNAIKGYMGDIGMQLISQGLGLPAGFGSSGTTINIG